jgi:replication factor C subunit 3/5
MALLVDKLRPRTLDALSYHPELSDRLRSLVRSPTLRNMNIILTQGALHRRTAEIFPIY